MSVSDDRISGGVVGHGGISIKIQPKEKDLGGFVVRRVLPAARQRAIGPFVFFDHMGPSDLPPGDGINVRPHPHIGLATITYLFDGEIVHRDSLGVTQAIRPGAVNLMTAGRGIVHSERAGDDLHQHAHLHGIQTWMALPEANEQCEPAFEHYPREALPELEIDGLSGRLIVGELLGLTSPVQHYSPMLYAEIRLEAGADVILPTNADELGVYVIAGNVMVQGEPLATGVMGVVAAPAALHLCTEKSARIMLAGGSSLGKRHLWWNFVASSETLIETAKGDWRAGRFAGVPEDSEFIPLPES